MQNPFINSTLEKVTYLFIIHYSLIVHFISYWDLAWQRKWLWKFIYVCPGILQKLTFSCDNFIYLDSSMQITHIFIRKMLTVVSSRCWCWSSCGYLHSEAVACNGRITGVTVPTVRVMRIPTALLASTYSARTFLAALVRLSVAEGCNFLDLLDNIRKFVIMASEQKRISTFWKVICWKLCHLSAISPL